MINISSKVRSTENIKIQSEPRFRGYSMNTLNSLHTDAAPGRYGVLIRVFHIRRAKRSVTAVLCCIAGHSWPHICSNIRNTVALCTS